MHGTLFLVALPIGNLADITLRAIETLKSVHFVLAEDTRTTRRVLERHGITTPFYSSIYQGAERQRIGDVLRQLADGKSLALVSDAGTPLINDPGFPLVRAAIEAGHAVIPVPGPCAAITAIIASGIPPDRFCFAGSLPRKEGDRRDFVSRLRAEQRTTIVYESPHRLEATLVMFDEVLPQRRLALARELTKVHEEFLRGSASDILAVLRDRGGVRGECVLIIEGSAEAVPGHDREAVTELIALLRKEGVSNRSILRVLALSQGIPRNEAYALVHSDAQ